MKRKNVKNICKVILVASMMTILVTGCGKKENKVTYGDTKGTVSGRITFDENGANLNIDNVIADAGSDVDYTSGIEVDGDAEYSLDVNASNVKYDTPGTYTARYTVKSGDKTYTEDIKVTIKKGSGSAVKEDSVDDNGNQQLDNDTNAENNDNNANPANGSNDSNGSNGSGNAVDSQNVNSNNNQNNVLNNNQNNSQNSNGQVPQQTTAKRELITESGKSTVKTKSIGNSSIELLSGDIVTIKCSTNNYIVETKTVESEVTKSGHNYKVTKLVVVFNTGKEQTVETIEKRID